MFVKTFFVKTRKIFYICSFFLSEFQFLLIYLVFYNLYISFIVFLCKFPERFFCVLQDKNLLEIGYCQGDSDRESDCSSRRKRTIAPTSTLIDDPTREIYRESIELAEPLLRPGTIDLVGFHQPEECEIQSAILSILKKYWYQTPKFEEHEQITFLGLTSDRFIDHPSCDYRYEGKNIFSFNYVIYDTIKTIHVKY